MLCPSLTARGSQRGTNERLGEKHRHGFRRWWQTGGGWDWRGLFWFWPGSNTNCLTACLSPTASLASPTLSSSFWWWLWGIDPLLEDTFWSQTIPAVAEEPLWWPVRSGCFVDWKMRGNWMNWKQEIINILYHELVCLLWPFLCSLNIPAAWSLGSDWPIGQFWSFKWAKL